MAIQRIEVDPVRGREQWLALRMQDITASDVASVCGVGMYNSAAHVWAQKRGLIGEQEETAAMKRGRWGESAVFAAIEDEFPDWQIRRAKVYFRDPELRIGATPDGAAIIPGMDGIVAVQAKVVSKLAFDQHWRAVPDDKSSPIVAPLAYQLQTLTETALASGYDDQVKRGLLAVLVVDTFKWSLHTVFVEKNEAAWERIKLNVASFRTNYLETGVQPPIDPEMDSELVKRLNPADNGLEIDLTGDNELPEIVDLLQHHRDLKKEAERNEEICKTIIADKMGAFAYAKLADGRRISNKLQTRGSYVVKESSYRVVRLLKDKGK